MLNIIHLLVNFLQKTNCLFFVIPWAWVVEFFGYDHLFLTNVWHSRITEFYCFFIENFEKVSGKYLVISQFLIVNGSLLKNNF